MIDYLDVEKVTANRRGYQDVPPSVLATRHPPYGHGLEPNATLIHRVRGVRIDYQTPRYAYLLAAWECGGATQHPTFLAEPKSPGKRLCRKCFHPSHV